MNKKTNLLNEEYRDGKWNVTGWWGVHEDCFNFGENPLHSAEPLKSMNWSSSGGSITSNYNVSIHQMGNLIAGEMYYLYQKTGSEYIGKRLHDTCVWGLVLPWPGPWDGGIWAASLTWASACVLLSCAEDIPDEFFQ